MAHPEMSWRGPRRQHGRQYLVQTMVMLIAIGAAIAIPAYQDYKTRYRVVTGFLLAVPAQRAIAASFEKTGPADMSQRAATSWLPPPASKEVTSVSIAKNGTITITYSQAIADPGSNHLQIVPVAGGEVFDLSDPASKGKPFEWQCGGDAGKTTIAAKLLPAKCRAASSIPEWLGTLLVILSVPVALVALVLIVAVGNLAIELLRSGLDGHGKLLDRMAMGLFVVLTLAIIGGSLAYAVARFNIFVWLGMVPE